MADLYYTEKGHGQPVVLIHGFCETNKIWEELSQHLSSTYRIISVDLPGFGQSQLPKNKFTLSDIAQSLNQWLDRIQIDSCVIIGHSLGGYVTLALAEAYPLKVRGFGLFHSTCESDPKEKKETRNKVISILETHGPEEFTDTFIPGLFYHKTEAVQKNIDKLVIEARKCTSESLIAYTQAMRDRPSRCHLMNGNKPVLFIGGEKDGAVPLESSIEQTKSLDPKFVHILPETGHMGMYERKSETTKMVSDFLKQFQ